MVSITMVSRLLLLWIGISVAKTSALALTYTSYEPPAADYDVIIIGGGITGLATAAALINREKISHDKIRIIEKSKEVLPVGATIGLFPNGAMALESISVQLADEVCSSGIQALGMIRKNLTTGKVEKRKSPASYSTGRGSHAVAWYILQQKLLDMVPEGVLCLGKVLESIQYNDGDEKTLVTVYYRDRSTNAIEKATCKVLIGADGIKSTARDILFPTYKESFDTKHDLNRKMFRAVLPREALKDVDTMPPRGYTVTYRCDKTDSVFAIRQLAEHVFGFTSAITQAHADDESAAAIMEDNASARFERLKQCFQDYPKDVRQWINAVDKNAIYENDIYDIDILEEWTRGSCVLIGDACHAMSPSLGQGANVGLEDSSELAAALGPILRTRTGGGGDASQIQTVLKEFWSSRLDRVSKIHAASRECRNGTGLDPAFRQWLYSWQPSFDWKSC